MRSLTLKGILCMGFLDFIKGRSRKSITISNIDISDSGLTIDGVHVDMPIHISTIAKLLGKPRAVAYKTSAESREFLEGMRGKGMVTKRVNYAWDDLGLYCYTENGAVLSTFGIRLSQQGDSYKHSPRKPFCGTVTINGRPWFEVLNTAEDMEVFRRYELECYSIIGEYTDPFEPPDSRTEQSYSIIEVGMK